MRSHNSVGSWGTGIVFELHVGEVDEREKEMDLKLKIAAIAMRSENGLTDGVDISYLRYRLAATELTSKAMAGTLHVIHPWACPIDFCIESCFRRSELSCGNIMTTRKDERLRYANDDNATHQAL